jgi:uroporphyrinogen-III decarboxylase
MSKTVSSKERVQNAINCETSDRVPVALRLDYCAARWSDISFQRFTLDPQKASEAIEWAFDRMGGWDAVDSTWTQGIRFTKLETWKMQIPGIALPPDRLPKIDDEPTMTAEDYDVAIMQGLYGLYTVIRQRFGGQYSAKMEEDIYKSFAPIHNYWEEQKGAVPFRGGMTRLPIFQFGYSRGWAGFIKDILKQPEKVKEACDSTFMDTVMMGENQSRAVGSKIIFVPVGHASPNYMSRGMYDQYFFPYFKEACKKLVNDGFTPRLHLNLDWTPNLEHLLELPKRSCIAELESVTDMRKAKEVLGGHMCICGGVPPHLLTRGTPEKIEAYCKKLINELGPDGYILMNDDIVPTKAKYENVKAVVDTAKQYSS